MKEPGRLVFWKIVHTVAWAFFVGCILYILYCGISGQINWMTWTAIVLVMIEGVVLLINGWVCPITPIARKYTDSQKDNFDIYLPDWLAKHNKTIFTVLFSFGIILVLIRMLN